ncbi:MAG: DUF5131 family protein [Patescibacteria group bacterium]
MNGPHNPIGYCDFSWNFLTGCLNDCRYCYGRKLAYGRLKPLYLNNSHVLAGDPADPYAIRWWPQRLEEPCRRARPSKIFAVDMGDLFGDQVPEQCREDGLKIVRACPHHTFIFLTKYPWNLKTEEWPENAWVGVTATHNSMAEMALYHLEKVKASVRFISAEPLLQSLENGSRRSFLKRMFKVINWVVIGAQTSPYRPPSTRWVDEIVREARQAGVPVFQKDNLLDALTVPPGKPPLIQEFPCYNGPEVRHREER